MRVRGDILVTRTRVSFQARREAVEAEVTLMASFHDILSWYPHVLGQHGSSANTCVSRRFCVYTAYKPHFKVVGTGGVSDSGCATNGAAHP